MKKLLCMILALIMVLSLCACGQEKPNNDNNQNAQGNVNDSQGNSENEEYDYSNEPPAEIWGKINRCDEIATELKNYVETGYLQYLPDNDFTQAVLGQAALPFYYEELQELVAIEDWYHCEWSNGFDFISQHTCPQDMLDGFSVLENVLLTLDCDLVGHTGDVEPHDAFAFSYNANYSIAKVDWNHDLIEGFYPHDPVQYAFHSIATGDWYGAEYIYDENGVLTQVKIIGYVDNDGDYYHNGEIKTHTLIDLERDAAGKLLSATATDYNGEKYVFEFTYDNQNRVSEIRRNKANANKSVTTQLFSCAYDNSGKQVSLEHTEYTTREDGTVSDMRNSNIATISYTYDATGSLTATNYNNTYTNDESDHFS